MRLTRSDLRDLERPLLQTLVPKDEATCFPPECLQSVTATIDEEEQVAIQYVHSEYRMDHTAESIE